MHRVIDIRCRSGIALLLTLAALPAGAAPSPSAGQPATASTREAATRDKLAGVRAEIAKIAAAQRKTATQRQAINAKLADQATRLDQAAAAVRETDAAITAQSAALAQLEARRTELESGLAAQRAALAELLRAAYTLDGGVNLPLLLGDGDIARIDRALAYSRYFQRDRVKQIHALLDAVANLGALEASIHAASAALQQQRTQRAARVTGLEDARSAQQALLAKADAELARQKDKLAELGRDAKALDQLLKQLQDVFADIPAEAGQHTPFPKLRGHLAQPVAGGIRSASGTTTHGIVITASPGAAVHAVAYGRVAWADFMRGYGMLVIIDHGDGWMSLYGGNESLLVSAGDWVKAGQTIATVGRNPEQGGAWFGLRHDGTPTDPRGWLTR